MWMLRALLTDSSVPTHLLHWTGRVASRVWQMSADFHRHPVGNLMQGVLALHDRSAFEVICLSLLVSEQRQRVVVRYVILVFSPWSPHNALLLVDNVFWFVVSSMVNAVGCVCTLCLYVHQRHWQHSSCGRHQRCRVGFRCGGRANQTAV
jgi:hypothetical protein